MPKHDAQKKLADYIEEYTGRLTKQDRSITTFGELWTAFSAVKSGCWSKKTREDLKYLFGKHVLPIVGNQQASYLHEPPAAPQQTGRRRLRRDLRGKN
jgi:hypothetical protein